MKNRDEKNRKEWLLRNCTNESIVLKGRKNASLRLPPLAEIPATTERLELFDKGKIALDDTVELTEVQTKFPWWTLFLFYGLIAYIVVGVFSGTPKTWLVGAAALIAATVVLLFLFKRGGKELWLYTLQTATLVLTLLLGAGIPALGIFLTSDLQLPYDVDVLAGSSGGVVVFGRTLQWLFITIASLAPGLMFFLFDRRQHAALRSRFVHEAFRLDPSITTEREFDTKYGRQVADVFGRARPDSQRRLVGGRRSPVVLATVLLAVGWTLTLLHADGGVASIAGQSVPNSDHYSTWLLSLFLPKPGIFTFAFLGAYVFTLEVVVRGYLRGDLRPKSYGRIVVRIVVVAVLAYVFANLYGSEDAPLAVVIGFGVGWFPESARQMILERFEQRLGSKVSSSLRESAPLTHIEGLDVYERARLIDEGVTNIEALAHHDLVDLILQTRIPSARLVDWVDQAILYIHTAGPLNQAGSDKPETESLIQDLRKAHIRTATEALSVWKDASARSALLNMLRPGAENALEVVVAKINGERWLPYIQHWRKRRQPRLKYIDCSNEFPSTSTDTTAVDRTGEQRQGNGTGMAGANESAREAASPPITGSPSYTPVQKSDSER